MRKIYSTENVRTEIEETVDKGEERGISCEERNIRRRIIRRERRIQPGRDISKIY